jgi:hypothetical protein
MVASYPAARPPAIGWPLCRLPQPHAAEAGTEEPSYLPVWSSISAMGALRLTDSMPLIALALLS